MKGSSAIDDSVIGWSTDNNRLRGGIEASDTALLIAAFAVKGTSVVGDGSTHDLAASYVAVTERPMEGVPANDDSVRGWFNSENRLC
jgi:hypothetical protein